MRRLNLVQTGSCSLRVYNPPKLHPFCQRVRFLWSSPNARGGVCDLSFSFFPAITLALYAVSLKSLSVALRLREWDINSKNSLLKSGQCESSVFCEPSVFILKDIGVPTPGVEPGPPGWKPGILTARPYVYRVFTMVFGFLRATLIIYDQWSKEPGSWLFMDFPSVHWVISRLPRVKRSMGGSLVNLLD